MAFYQPANVFSTPAPMSMLPPPAAVQPYTPTPPMGISAFAPSSVDPLMMQQPGGFPPPPPLPPPGGTPMDMMMAPQPPPLYPLQPPHFVPGFIGQQLSCWRECVGCLAIALCWCFLCDDYEPEQVYQ
ncbi:hypothetical protein BDB00DRAFT_869449 [Zychaea mexicana]|uniref:uncharacterized protein n=1 Tax=Zychaea mexicana TaxID=64656 RepID=UPI0022FE6FDD|nr:uncharacterized protein BDB00DRAFT_869449 [Zychaea mexicana]KAI9496517.1 hypothetical protein BDB00DRAFT_869449 [Zychaea mexicana]